VADVREVVPPAPVVVQEVAPAPAPEATVPVSALREVVADLTLQSTACFTEREAVDRESKRVEDIRLRAYLLGQGRAYRNSADRLLRLIAAAEEGVK
jgi:hypothetical protein